MSRRFQFTISDGLLLTAVIAAIVASIATHEAVVSLITLSALLAFIWHRPVIFRLWATGTMGIGSGILVAIYFHSKGEHQYLSNYRMNTNDLAGWGAGLLVGAFVAYRAFLSNPPPKD